MSQPEKKPSSTSPEDDSKKPADKKTSTKKTPDKETSSPSRTNKTYESSKVAVGTPSETTGKRLYLAAFFGACAIISWQEIRTFQRLPLPSRFVGAGMAFGLLALAEPIITPPLAGTLAWGLLFGLAYRDINKEKILADVPNGVVPIPLVLSTPKKGN